MKSKSKWLSAIVTLSVVFVLVLSLGLSTIFASAADGDASAVAVDPVRYYNDYNDVDEADEAARDMNESLEEEGIVLLKNDGALPLSTSSRVSVFGIAQDAMVESDGSVAESLSNAGFRVNTALQSFYESDDCDYNSYGTESSLGTREKESVKNYSDVGVVVIGRGGPGEYAVDATGVGEAEDETYLDGKFQGWTHEASFDYTPTEQEANNGAVEITGAKHELELTNSEKELISYAEQSCKKVIVMYSGAQVLEMSNLEGDDNVNGILWIGRPGEGGSDAIGKVLSGEVNPSGKLVDEWTRDLTNDPTFANAEMTDYTYTDSDSKAVGLEDSDNPGTDKNYNGIDYEEDIYLGYKFYETYWEENKDSSNLSIPGLNDTSNATADEWYNYNVVYPFGYGLSYTSFSYDLQSVKTNLGTEVGNSISADSLSTSAGDVKENQNVTANKIVSMTASVKVTNTGSERGKEVVQVYVEAPYGSSATGNTTASAGDIEKPYYTLVGFGKTSELNPGQSETVDITFNVQDFASYDYTDANKDGHSGYELDLGSYTIHVMESSSHKNIVDDKLDEDAADKTNAYESYNFTIIAGAANSSGNYVAAHLDADDWSGNAVGNLFSTTDSSNTQSDYYSMYMSAASGTMTSPLDIDTTHTASTMLSRADKFAAMPTAPTSASVGDATAAATVIGVLEKYDDIYANEGGYDNETDPWYHDYKELDGWTQGAGKVGSDGLYEITLDDMSGRSADDPLWVTFMNQLTWEEMCSIINDAYHFTAEITTIGKVETTDENGPNVIPKGPYLAGTPTRSATWNQDLLYQSGIVAGDDSLMHGATGYYGPGVNTHRGPFGGRNAEYFSQDGIQAGYMGAAFCAGMSDRGINVYVKHFALNDVGLPSNSSNIVVNVSEQAMREIYLKPFQMCMQEGGCRACMTALNRIGAVWCGQNYALQQQLAKDEWGWTGYFITDTIGMLPNMTADGLVRTGANLPDGNFSTQTKVVGVDEETGKNIEETYGYLSGEWDPDYDWSDELITDSIITANQYKTVGTKDANGETITLQSLVSASTGYESFTVPVGAVRYTTEQTDATTGETKTVMATASPTQWYCVRQAAMEVLYNACNSAANYNGITAKQLETQDIDLTGDNAVVQQGLNATRTVTETIYVTDLENEGNDTEMYLETSVDGVSILDVDEDVLSRVTYSAVTDGELPDGMYIENGLLYGTSLVSGTFTFTVLSYVDYWIPMTSEVTLEVIQSVYLSDYFDDLSNMTVGTQARTVYLVYDGDVWDYTEWNFNYVLVDGELPEGLTLDEETGRIEGTATTAGTYTFTLGVSIYSDTDYYLDLDSRGQFAIDSLWSYGWFYLEDNYDGTGEEGGAKFIDENGNIKEAELCQWILDGGSWGGMAFGGYLLDSVKVKDPTVYTVTYTITVSNPSDGSEVDADEAGSGSGSSSGLAIAALVLAIVAIVAAAVVLVIVLLKRNSGGSSSGNSGDGDRPAVD